MASDCKSHPIPSVFSAAKFGSRLARALDGLLVVQAEDAKLYRSSLEPTVRLCGSLGPQPQGDDFYAADQLSRHYYTGGDASIRANFEKLPGLDEVLDGLHVLKIREMLAERWACDALMGRVPPIADVE
jgi:hypothetical protein